MFSPFCGIVSTLSFFVKIMCQTPDKGSIWSVYDFVDIIFVFIRQLLHTIIVIIKRIFRVPIYHTKLTSPTPPPSSHTYKTAWLWKSLEIVIEQVHLDSHSQLFSDRFQRPVDWGVWQILCDFCHLQWNGHTEKIRVNVCVFIHVCNTHSLNCIHQNVQILFAF